jgi:hypothetical protein
MSVKGAYDDIVGNGSFYVFHVAGNFGTDYHLWKNSKNNADGDNNHEKGRLQRESMATTNNHNVNVNVNVNVNDDEKYYSYDHTVYESYVVAMEWLLQSVDKHKGTSDMLEYITHYEGFEDEERFDPVLLQDDSSSDSESQSCSDSGSAEESDDKNDSSSSCCSEDSYGVSEWDTTEKNTTTWSDPIAVFNNKGSDSGSASASYYEPRNPQQTVLETAASIRDRWTVLGRDLTPKECSDYYTVAEMDGLAGETNPRQQKKMIERNRSKRTSTNETKE